MAQDIQYVRENRDWVIFDLCRKVEALEQRIQLLTEDIEDLDERKANRRGPKRKS